MESAPGGSTYVFVDGQNLRGSARDFFGQSNLNSLDLDKLIHRIAAADDAQVKKVSYYSGIRPSRMNDGLDRAADIAFMDILRGSGVSTFGNDLVQDAMGRWGENGIDLKISCDMIVDFLSDPHARTFMVVSNDTDFAPTFELLRIVANNLASPRDVDCVQVLCGARPDHLGIRGIRKIDVLPPMYEACLRDPSVVTDLAAERMRTDPVAAWDIGANGLKTSVPSNFQMAPSRKPTGFYVDANSLGATAKRRRGADCMNLDVRAVIGRFLGPNDRKGFFGHVFASVPDAVGYPVQNETVRSVLDYAAVGDGDIPAPTIGGSGVLHKVPMAMAYYAPKVSVVKEVASSDLKVCAKTPVEKRVETEILKKVVLDCMRGAADEFVLMSDRASLWPIAHAVRDIAKRLNIRAQVTNVHLVQPGIPGMESYHIDEAAHASLVCPRDHMASAKANVSAMLSDEKREVAERYGAKFGPATKILVAPLSFEGTFVEQTDHYTILDDGRRTFALIANFPVVPKEGGAYQVVMSGEHDERLPVVTVLEGDVIERSLMPMKSYASSGPVDRDSGSSSVIRR